LQRYREPVIHYIYHMVRNRAIAEELTQNVFLRIFRSRAGYQPTSNFANWLFRIANHVALNWLRDNRHQRTELSLSVDPGRGPGWQIADGKPTADQALIRQGGAGGSSKGNRRAAGTAAARGDPCISTEVSNTPRSRTFWAAPRNRSSHCCSARMPRCVSASRSERHDDGEDPFPALTLGVIAVLGQSAGATFGDVIRLGGTPSDIVLDEPRNHTRPAERGRYPCHAYERWLGFPGYLHAFAGNRSVSDHAAIWRFRVSARLPFCPAFWPPRSQPTGARDLVDGVRRGVGEPSCEATRHLAQDSPLASSTCSSRFPSERENVWSFAGRQ
jgi:RNA polymerase sigma factor (sigma-70 family)